jgi:hypothetical protein
VQGYFFSRPVPPDHIPELIERWSGIVVIGTQRARARARQAREPKREHKSQTS